MTVSLLFALGAMMLGFCLVSRRLERTAVTGPMVFVVFGALLSPRGLGWFALEIPEPVIHLLAEVTLALILFGDAARIDLSALRQGYGLPLRLLLIGMPLTIGLGLLIGWLLFPQLALWELAVLATILAPTDAALGQAVVSSSAVPMRIRQALNVESGLNDGIALPVLTIFISLALATQGGASGEHARSAMGWILFTLGQIGLGPAVGAGVAFLCGKLLLHVSNRGWINDSHERLVGLAVAVLAYTGAQLVGGNGFIAAFVAGLTFGNISRDFCRSVYEFLEAEAQLLMLMVFLVLGFSFAWPALEESSAAMWLYAALSLTLARLLPVAVSLSGARLRWSTVAFLGWFGPRGLASVVFALLVISESGLTHAHTIASVALLTVTLSTFAHGLTAAPGARAYGRSVEGMEDHESEMKAVGEHPTRHSP